MRLDSNLSPQKEKRIWSMRLILICLYNLESDDVFIMSSQVKETFLN